MSLQWLEKNGKIHSVAWVLAGAMLSGVAVARDYNLELTRGSFAKSWTIPCTETSIRIGGMIKADGIVDLDGTVPGTGIRVDKPDYTLVPLPSDLDSNGVHVKFNSKDTLFFIETRTPTCYGCLNTYIEADFFSDAYRFDAAGSDTNVFEEVTTNSSPLVMRHAYGTFYKFLAGQTWTNFMDPEVIPEVLTHNGMVGRTHIRQTQFRWEDDLGCVAYGLSIENPETDFTNNSGLVLRKRDKYPDATAYFKIPLDIGYVRFSGVLRYMQVVGTTEAIYDDSRLAWGVGVSTKLNVYWRDLPGCGHNLKIAFAAGEGIGRYIEVFAHQALSCSTTECKKLKAVGVYGAYQHHLSRVFRMNLGYGYAKIDNDASMPDTTNEKLTAPFINFIWAPVKNANFGLEMLFPRRKLENGEHGSLKRLLFSSRFYF